jgi:hypothetical protein
MEDVDDLSTILSAQREIVDRLAAMAATQQEAQAAQQEAHRELMTALMETHRELMATFEASQTRAAEQQAAQQEAHRELMDAIAGQQERSTTQPYAFQHSHITEEAAKIVRDRLELQCVDVATGGTESARTLKSLIPFDWEKSSWVFLKREDNLRKWYHEHTANYILGKHLKRTLGVFGVEHNGHTLNAAFITSGVYLNGTADMLIAPLGDPRSRVEDARAVIEVKKSASNAWKSSNAHHQAMSELLALDQHAAGVVFSVLTDLREVWIFYWLGPGRQVASLKLNNLHAGVETLRDFLSADCAWIGSPVNIALTHAATVHIRATKLRGEAMQAPHSDPSQHPAPATTGAASAARTAASTAGSEPPKTYPLRTPTKRLRVRGTFLKRFSRVVALCFVRGPGTSKNRGGCHSSPKPPL